MFEKVNLWEKSGAEAQLLIVLLLVVLIPAATNALPESTQTEPDPATSVSAAHNRTFSLPFATAQKTTPHTTSLRVPSTGFWFTSEEERPVRVWNIDF